MWRNCPPHRVVEFRPGASNRVCVIRWVAPSGDGLDRVVSTGRVALFGARLRVASIYDYWKQAGQRIFLSLHLHEVLASKIDTMVRLCRRRTTALGDCITQHCDLCRNRCFKCDKCRNWKRFIVSNSRRTRSTSHVKFRRRLEVYEQCDAGLGGAARKSICTFIEPGRPIQNGSVESFQPAFSRRVAERACVPPDDLPCASRDRELATRLQPAPASYLTRLLDATRIH